MYQVKKYIPEVILYRNRTAPLGKKVVYRYDGIYYVVATIDNKNGDVVGLGGEVVDARVFFLVRAEPCFIMQRLIMEQQFLNTFLPNLNNTDTGGM
jgi:hypothetical protein